LEASLLVEHPSVTAAWVGGWEGMLKFHQGSVVPVNIHPCRVIIAFPIPKSPKDSCEKKYPASRARNGQG